MSNKCQFCGNGFKSEELYYGFQAMTMPVPEIEKKKEKWGEEWWKNLERNDLTEEESQELDQLSSYDQALNTISRGYVCYPCLEKENELLNKYYPNE